MGLQFTLLRSVALATALIPSILASGAHAASTEDANGQAASSSGYAMLLPQPSALPEPVLPPTTAPESGAFTSAPVGIPAPLLPSTVAAAAPAQPAKAALLRWGYMVGSTLPDSVLQHPRGFDYLSPDWFHLDYNGDVYGDASGQVKQFATANGIKLVPIVANGEFDADVAHAIVSDGTLQTHVLDSLQALLSDPAYAGINIDFENLYASDRDLFSAFMTNVYARLHPLGKLVTIALPAKTSDADPYSFAGPFDYAGLAPHFDMAVLMTYDDHWSGGGAGAIAPLDWVGDVVNYATKYIPAHKLLLGLEFYGYDWNISWGGQASAIGYNDIVSTILDTGGQVYMDPQSHTPVYTYQGDDGMHQIWFENSTSLGYKLTLVENKGLAGWGGWRVGLEDQNFWSLNLTGRQA